MLPDFPKNLRNPDGNMEKNEFSRGKYNFSASRGTGPKCMLLDVQKAWLTCKRKHAFSRGECCFFFTIQGVGPKMRAMFKGKHSCCSAGGLRDLDKRTSMSDMQESCVLTPHFVNVYVAVGMS